MKVVGIQRNMNFKAQDGNQVTGMNIYLTQEKHNVEGVATDKVFVSSTKECYASLANLKIGSEVQLLYNRWGKVESVIVR